MSDGKAGKNALTGGSSDPRADEAERVLGRAVSALLPVGTVVGALAVGFAASAGSAILVLASGVLLGAIALLWTSLRTLSGDAPLPADFAGLGGPRTPVDALAEEKRRALRALRDLEGEHALGRIDDADYESFVAQYREEAKSLMRRMDQNLAPSRADAEQLAQEYVSRKGAQRAAAVEGPGKPLGQSALAAAPERAERGADRVACKGCGASNERDAAFCKRCGAAIKKAAERSDRTT